MGLERLIKRHGLAGEFLESQEHLLVEWKLRLGFLTIFSLAQAQNDALFALSFPVGLDIEFTCAFALTTGLKLGKLIIAEVEVVALECDRFGNLVEPDKSKDGCSREERESHTVGGCAVVD